MAKAKAPRGTRALLAAGALGCASGTELVAWAVTAMAEGFKSPARTRQRARTRGHVGD